MQMTIRNQTQLDIINIFLHKPIDVDDKCHIKLKIQYIFFNKMEHYDSEDIASILNDELFEIELFHFDEDICLGIYKSYNRALYETLEFLKAYNNGEQEYVFPDERDVPESLDLSKTDVVLELWDEVDKIKSATLTFDQLSCEIEF